MNKIAQSLPALAALIFLSFPIAMGLASTLMVLILLAWLFSGNYQERWIAIRNNPVALAALLLYGVIVLGTSYSVAPVEDIVLHLKKYSKLLFVALLISVLGDERWQRRCLQAFTGAMLFILVSTWLNVWFRLPWSASQTPGWGVTHHVVGDYITQNVMMSFFVLLSLVYAHEQQMVARRSAWLAIALLAAVSITHLSQGRTGYVLLAVALLVFAFMMLKGRTLWVMLATSILGLTIALASSDLVIQRFERAAAEFKNSDSNNLSSIGHRLYNYKTTPQLIAEKPLFGGGTGSYHTEICRIVEKSEWCQVFSWHPHNQFLYFGADHGLLGILAYLFLIAAMIRLALRDSNQHSRTLLLGLAALLTVDSLFNSPLWSSRESHFFLFMMALLAARSGLALRSQAGMQSAPEGAISRA